MQYQALVVEQKALTEDEFWSSSAMLKVAGVAGGPGQAQQGPLCVCCCCCGPCAFRNRRQGSMLLLEHVVPCHGSSNIVLGL